MNPSKWSNVAVAVQSALATAVTVNSITKANPAVVGYTGTDPVNGDFIVMTATGMRQVDARVFRVANVVGGSNTLELEGVDSTNFDTFVSGSFQVITFGTSLGTVSSINASGGDFDFIDITTIHDNQKRQIPNLPNPLVFTMDNIWDPADPGLVALKLASDNQAKRAIRFGFAGGAGQKVVFTGYVGASLSPTGSAGDKVVTPVVITADGALSVYAT